MSKFISIDNGVNAEVVVLKSEVEAVVFQKNKTGPAYTVIITTKSGAKFTVHNCEEDKVSGFRRNF